MIIKEVMYAPGAAKQVIHKFNNDYNTSISYIKTEVLEGTPFVHIDLDDTHPSLIFKFGFLLGELQNYLEAKGEQFLPLKTYPLPPKKD